MKKFPDTITAIATPSGRGGVGIVRISGRDAKKIALALTGRASEVSSLQTKTSYADTSEARPVRASADNSNFFQPRVVRFSKFYDLDQSIIDEGIILFFENPHSFTGEDVVELQSHGSPIVLDRLIKLAIHYGARMARPGEFSQRAFLNKKIDLTQAEAIADLIAANSEAAARSAVRSLQGEFSKKIHVLLNSLIHLRLQIEAMLDFPEEEIDFLKDPAVAKLLQKTIDDVLKVKNEAKQGVLLQQGLHIVIAGKPNVGKSSLLNYLSGRDSAIVTDIAGTTRDILRESINIDGLPLHIIDTAGLRETDDLIEQEGVRRAREQMQQADLILLVVDATECDAKLSEVGAPVTTHELVSKMMEVGAPATTPILLITNKIDLTNEPSKTIQHKNFTEIKISIKNNLGLDLLKNAIKVFAGFQSFETDGFIARRRHVDAIDRAYQFLLHGQQQLTNNKAGELLAEDLRQAQNALSEITGEFTSDDLLGKIFSSFCIGK